jgi:carnosine N-methyltransferase
VLSSSAINFPETLNRIDQAIEHNAEIAENILRCSVDSFGVDPELLKGNEWLDTVTADDVDKTRSSLKQFYRDWSIDGATERDVCYAPVMKELDQLFGNLSDEGKAEIQVLIPGAGLGRLAYEIAVAGYSSQVCEWGVFLKFTVYIERVL